MAERNASLDQDAGGGDIGEDLAAFHANNAGYVIRRLWQRRTQLWQDIVPGDLTMTQFMVLAVLREHGRIDQQTMARHARLDKSTAGPLVTRLCAVGLIEIQRDPADGRRKLLELTPEGREAVSAATPFVAIVEDRLLEPLTAAERTSFLDLGGRVVAADETLG
jgi:DNA-binding MarR family transcriptional regulator